MCRGTSHLHLYGQVAKYICPEGPCEHSDRPQGPSEILLEAAEGVLGHFRNPNVHGLFVPGGVGVSIKSILATLTAGLIFSSLGFEQLVQIAG